eukprot:CAMPEP_0175084392 /NCGR_PEP_ID=MMETSP0052_2-20121109/28018_1 /TAXON_ID=51329 ORGANISM="Polytomella parva, Strain SAG 63-3" /NCGR_SAMPLE_ID=MMETSP0052_2 /ASSEMBLY_ACC=CAM_ASM_000194 /LENGTH=563 /DNA_ID=CAMNT_0016356159 /DNA_START=168 /DNA_END=1859 /DNA_ORIENTATION=-
MTSITASLDAPFPGRPMEGSIHFNVEISPMASPAFETHQNRSRRQSELATELVRYLERVLRQSGCLDLESLCVITGSHVWNLRLDTHVLNHDGNLMDACALSSLAALHSFRRSDVEFLSEGGTEILVIHSPDVKEPHPLTLFHFPISATFSIFDVSPRRASPSASSMDVSSSSSSSPSPSPLSSAPSPTPGLLASVLDPNVRESAAAAGSVSIAMTMGAHDVCVVQKVGGVGLSAVQLDLCRKIAAEKVDEVAGKLREAVMQYHKARLEARVRRHLALTPEEAARYLGLEGREKRAKGWGRDMRDMRDGEGEEGEEGRREGGLRKETIVNGREDEMDTDDEMGTEDDTCPEVEVIEGRPSEGVRGGGLDADEVGSREGMIEVGKKGGERREERRRRGTPIGEESLKSKGVKGRDYEGRDYEGRGIEKRKGIVRDISGNEATVSSNVIEKQYHSKDSNNNRANNDSIYKSSSRNDESSSTFLHSFSQPPKGERVVDALGNKEGEKGIMTYEDLAEAIKAVAALGIREEMRIGVDRRKEREGVGGARLKRKEGAQRKTAWELLGS